MSELSRAPERERIFTSLYDAVYADLVRFVQRRTHLDHAEDVVAEALTVVWRRFDEVPRGEGDARAWIFGITRNILLNEHRGTHRRSALSVRLAETAGPPGTDPGTETVLMQVDLSRAWALLSEVHQETLSLVVFEELAAPQAATVLGISPVAFRLRLSRARRALRLHLDHPPRPVGTLTCVTERTAP